MERSIFAEIGRKLIFQYSGLRSVGGRDGNNVKNQFLTPLNQIAVRELIKIWKKQPYSGVLSFGERIPAQSLLESDMRSDGRAGISAAGEMIPV